MFSTFKATTFTEAYITAMLFRQLYLIQSLLLSNQIVNQTWNTAWNISGIIARRSGISEVGIVRLIVAFLLFAILFPIAMSQITSATTTSWNSAVATVFSVLTPILVVLAAALGFFSVVESRGNL